MRKVMTAPLLLAICLVSTERVWADAEVTFRGTLIEAPPCVVNNNELITVSFGDEVMTTRVDGVNYRQAVPFTLDCSEALSVAQKIRITGATTNNGFEREVLDGSTSINGLGIALYNGNVALAPGSWINFNWPNVPLLFAVPVKKSGETLSGGSFRVLASLVVDYQ